MSRYLLTFTIFLFTSFTLYSQCFCPNIYDPVCGSNGVTYSNGCYAECEGIYDYTPGECQCLCPAIYNPVCGDNGLTYANACYAECDGVFSYTSGECSVCTCPAIYDPVCGSDGVTYPNSCEAECAGVSWADGACATVCDCICPALFDPVCGSDGTTYSNSCEADCAGVSYSIGACDAVDLCTPCICPAVYDPVCATDYNITYSNQCSADCANAGPTVPGVCTLIQNTTVIAEDSPPPGEYLSLSTIETIGNVILPCGHTTYRSGRITLSPGFRTSANSTLVIDIIDDCTQAENASTASTNRQPYSVTVGKPMSDPVELNILENPVRSAVKLSFYLPQEGTVELVLLNMQGKLEKKLLQGQLSAGKHEALTFPIPGLSAGSYVVMLRTQQQAVSELLIKMSQW